MSGDTEATKAEGDALTEVPVWTAALLAKLDYLWRRAAVVEMPE